MKISLVISRVPSLGTIRINVEAISTLVDRRGAWFLRKSMQIPVGQHADFVPIRRRYSTSSKCRARSKCCELYTYPSINGRAADKRG